MRRRITRSRCRGRWGRYTAPYEARVFGPSHQFEPWPDGRDSSIMLMESTRALHHLFVLLTAARSESTSSWSAKPSCSSSLRDRALSSFSERSSSARRSDRSARRAIPGSAKRSSNPEPVRISLGLRRGARRLPGSCSASGRPERTSSAWPVRTGRPLPRAARFAGGLLLLGRVAFVSLGFGSHRYRFLKVGLHAHRCPQVEFRWRGSHRSTR